MAMVRKPTGQATIFENPVTFTGARINPENRWVKMAGLVPWEMVEAKYGARFVNPEVGNIAKPGRMALGSLIIKEKYQESDEEVVSMIQENPYLQYFIGLTEYTNKAPFDASTMTWFRKRLSPELIAEVNEYISGRRKKEDGDGSDHPSGDNGGSGEQPENKGTLILDATCVPSDIRFPTDVSLLNEGREKLEEIIDALHDPKDGRKPRTYREQARKKYLRFVRNRRPSKKHIRQAIRQQLGYVRRDLSTIEALMGEGKELSPRQTGTLETVRELYRQQKGMYDLRQHKTEHRIVSVHQPWVRPIVRGKATAEVEFGAKVSLSMTGGYTFIERLEWEAYNESGTLQDTVEAYKRKTGYYPKRLLADKIYRTRDNLNFCKKHGIRFHGPKLGRPPADKDEYAHQKRLERMEAGERNAVEGKIGEGKRTYGWGRLTVRLKETSEVSIHITVLMMNIMRRMRAILLLFFRWLENRLINYCFYSGEVTG
jgi:transposase, IS5 family